MADKMRKDLHDIFRYLQFYFLGFRMIYKLQTYDGDVQSSFCRIAMRIVINIQHN